MPAKKTRIRIPKQVAAKVLFASDRRCCVCREAGKRLQIHHLDEDPANNEPHNLAPLCYDCHDLTQVSGGFGRNLDSDQVILYRDNWVRFVASQRQAGVAESDSSTGPDYSVELATSLAELYRDNNELGTLAQHYHTIGNTELRDKWTEKALASPDVDDATIVYLRGLQNRPDLIPEDVANRWLGEQAAADDWSQRARTLVKLHRWPEAVVDYMKGIASDIESGNLFAAAYYLKELARRELYNELFLMAYGREERLWWQVRALQELGMDDERRDLLIANEDKIRAEGNPLLLIELAWALKDRSAYMDARKRLASSTRYMGGGIVGTVTDTMSASDDEDAESESDSAENEE